MAGDGEGIVVAVEEEDDLAAVSAELAGDLREDVAAGWGGADGEFAGGERVGISHSAGLALYVASIYGDSVGGSSE